MSLQLKHLRDKKRFDQCIISVACGKQHHRASSFQGKLRHETVWHITHIIWRIQDGLCRLLLASQKVLGRNPRGKQHMIKFTKKYMKLFVYEIYVWVNAKYLGYTSCKLACRQIAQVWFNQWKCFVGFYIKNHVACYTKQQNFPVASNMSPCWMLHSKYVLKSEQCSCFMLPLSSRWISASY